MKSVNFYMAVALTSVFMCSCGSKTTKVFNTPETILLPENIIEENHLTQEDQVTLIPVKSEVLLKDIGETVCYGDYMFMFSSDRATLYELYKDSVIGVLDRQGRGPGEYINLSSITYSEEDSLLYVCSVGSESFLQIYRGRNFVHVGKVEFPINDDTQRISSFCLVDSKHIMVSQPDIHVFQLVEDNNKFDIDTVDYGGMYIFDLQTKEYVDTLLRYDIYDAIGQLANASNCGYCRHDGGVAFSIQHFNHVTIYNYADGKVTQGPSFRYDDMFACPDKYIITDLSENDGEQYSNFMIWSYPYPLNDQRKSFGAKTLRVDGDKISFWNIVIGSSQEGWTEYNYNVYDGKDVARYNYKIDNMSWRVLPQFVYKGRYGELWQGTPNMQNSEEEYTPLQKKIIEAYELQMEDDNPVIFLYNSL